MAGNQAVHGRMAIYQELNSPTPRCRLYGPDRARNEVGGALQMKIHEGREGDYFLYLGQPKDLLSRVCTVRQDVEVINTDDPAVWRRFAAELQ